MANRKLILGVSTLTSFILLTMVTMLLVGAPSASGAQTPPMPRQIIFGTHEVGTGAYHVIALVIESMIQKYPQLKVLAVPNGVDISRAIMLRLGDINVGMAPAATALALQDGLVEYAAMEWGPQRIRYLWLPQTPGNVMAVLGKSNIYKIEDLKGRTVANYPPSPGPVQITESFLAFGGLTWRDVVNVDYPSAAPSYRALLDGKLDSCFWNIGGSAAYEGAALPGGIRYLPMPASDIEGWKRLRGVMPSAKPRLATVGGGISKDKPAAVATYAYPSMICFNSLPEDTAYWVSRTVNETYDLFKLKDKVLEADWSLNITFDLWDDDHVPMHPGAVRYFKEIGVWTPAREKMQMERLKHQDEVQALWKETLAEAQGKKMKSSDFPKFWMQKRATKKWFTRL